MARTNGASTITPETDQVILLMHRRGMAGPKIAKAIGRTRQAVSLRLAAMRKDGRYDQSPLPLGDRDEGATP